MVGFWLDWVLRRIFVRTRPGETRYTVDLVRQGLISTETECSLD